MNVKNRIAGAQADYLFMIMQRPRGWRPTQPEEIPPGGKVLSVDHVASLDEALDDLIRCNKLALKHDLKRWAVIQSGGGEP
jgi:hypothetical protein